MRALVPVVTDHRSSSRSYDRKIGQRCDLVTPPRRTPWTMTGSIPAPRSEGSVSKAEEKRAAIIAQQAARQREEQPNAAPMPKRKTNWAATPPLRPRRGRPPTGGQRG